MFKCTFCTCLVTECFFLALKTTPNTRWGKHNLKVQQKARIKLKNSDQILKQRNIAEKKRRKNARKGKKKKG